MSFTFENQGTNTYLVYEIGAGDELDTMSLGMLTNNTIPGFAAASFTQMDQTKFVKYNVSSKLSAAQLFAGTVNKKRLLGVFTGVVNAMLAAEDYMIDSNSILLDMNYIFADVSTCETVVVCMPVMNSAHQNPELNMFFKNIIFNTQFDQTENCDHVAQILNYLNGVQTLNLADFKNLLDSISKNAAPAKPVASQPAPQPAPPVQQPPAQVLYTPPVQPVPPVVQPVPPVKPVTPPVPPVPPVKPVPPVVPPVNPTPVPPVQPAPAGKAEKPMSMFYLLQHYNKENAALYKAQHAKGAAPAPQPAPAPQNFAVPGQQPAPQNFAVPGKQPAAPQNIPVPGKPAPAPQNFAVPGKQPAPAPAPQNFAIPGQKPAPVAAPQNFAVPGQKPVAPQPVQPVTPPVPPVQPVQPVRPVQPVQPVYQPPVQGGQHIDYGGTVVLGGGSSSATTILGPSAPNAQTPHLIRSKTGEKIMLNKPLFHIGKERSYADYVIADNSAISRSHADILQENGEFFVMDTNSTNHTYVDGKQITSNVKTKLSHGSKIRFANEDFEFNLF